MKYWKGKPETNKEGEYGTMDNNGFVPDSFEVTKEEYDEYVSSKPVLPKKPESDIEKLVKYAKNQKWID